MRFFTLFAALICAAVTASCGFHPVYGVNKYTAVGVEEYLSQTAISSIPDREGQYLRNALIDRFYRSGRPASPQYTLNVAPITEISRDLDITIDSDTTRGQLVLTTSISLQNNQTRENVLDRNLRSVVSYNIIDSQFANRVSEQNTRENALNDLARQIEEQLAFYFKRQKN